jgi:hypothetical protein
MKNIKRAIAILSLTICLIAPISLLSQDVPPPPPAGGHGLTGNQESGAPIGGGLFILLSLGAAYGGTKAYKFYQKKKKSLLE